MQVSLFKSVCCLGGLLFAGCEVPETPATAKPLPAHNPAAAQAAESLQEAWQLFASAVIKNDVATIKALSAPQIHCADCVTNTPEEEAAWQVYQAKNPDTWYDKLYKERANVSVDVFLKDDGPIIFDERTTKRLLDKSKLAFSEDLPQKEVLVTIIDPSEESEGMQAAFAFEQTKAGYRFCGYSTIP